MADGLDLTPNRIVEIPAPRGIVRIGQSLPVAFIAGPCQLESRTHALEMSAAIREIADRVGAHMIYKTSFDKANRSSISTARGLGLSDSLAIFAEIRETSGLPVLTDVHLPDQCAEAAQAVDVLQIPAFLSRQTDLLIAAAQTGKPVNVKKGQFLAPWDMKNVVNKLVQSGRRELWLQHARVRHARAARTRRHRRAGGVRCHALCAATRRAGHDFGRSASVCAGPRTRSCCCRHRCRLHRDA